MKGWEPELLRDVRVQLLEPVLERWGKAEPGALWFLLAVGGTETGFGHSVQRGARGEPLLGLGRGWWQFELETVTMLLQHRASERWLLWALPPELLRLGAEPIWRKLAWDGQLAALLARGLLWTNPRPLPEVGDIAEGWKQYLFLWRPGKPNRRRFELWAEASKYAMA